MVRWPGVDLVAAGIRRTDLSVLADMGMQVYIFLELFPLVSVQHILLLALDRSLLLYLTLCFLLSYFFDCFVCLSRGKYPQASGSHKTPALQGWSCF